jgi:phosphoribosylaminoimidazolecarboxamide formyltransferase/IMP cyclohydrolase
MEGWGKKMDKTSKEDRKQYRTPVKEEFPDTLRFGDRKFKKRLPMRYGENPGYPAAFYSEKEASGPNMATMEILQEGTKGLSYINIGDMDLGQRLVKKLTDIYENRLICVLVKHEMPSGVAKGESPEEAFAKAWNCDSLSNFGSVDVFNYRITGQLAELIVEKGRNIEVVYAPDFTPEALEVLASRKPLRIVKMGTALEAKASDNGLDFKRVAGGLLIQKRFDSMITSPESIDIVSERKATAEEIEAAIFNWNVACFTRSNAIVIGMKDKVHGIGSGQRSRIDAAETAIRYSKRGYGPEGCVMASDAFIPFTDVVELAARSGIKAIIYPLGSVRDQDVIDKANEHNMAMIITRKPGESDSERCFLHR